MSHLLSVLVFLLPTGNDTLLPIKPDTLFTIRKAHDFVISDKLNNFYIINNDAITRYQPNGDSLLQQSFKKYGDVETFDATQALRPVLFYPSQSLVVTVDNTLSIQNEPVDLTQWQLEQCTMLAASNLNNGFWLFDNGTMELIRVDHTWKIINRSGNLTTALNQAPQPRSMRENNSRLYMHLPGVGIAIFDQYANYLKTLPISALSVFDVYGDMIYYLQNGDLYQYDMKNFSTSQITLGAQLVSFSVNGNRLYLGNSEKVTVLGFN